MLILSNSHTHLLAFCSIHNIIGTSRHADAPAGRLCPIHLMALADPRAQWFTNWTLAGVCRATLMEEFGGSGLLAMAAAMIDLPIDAALAAGTGLPPHAPIGSLSMEPPLWAPDGEPVKSLGHTIAYTDLKQLATLHALSLVARAAVYAQGRREIALRLGEPALVALTDLLVKLVANPAPAPFKAVALAALVDRANLCATSGAGDEPAASGSSATMAASSSSAALSDRHPPRGSDGDDSSQDPFAEELATLERYLPSGFRPAHVVALSQSIGRIWSPATVAGRFPARRARKTVSVGSAGELLAPATADARRPLPAETASLMSSCHLLSNLATSPLAVDLFLPPSCLRLPHGPEEDVVAPIDHYMRELKVALEETCPGGAAWRA